MNDNPFFSVIIPTHNGAKHIRKALESCSEQTFRDFETIVICDACDDNTADIAREYTSIVLTVNHHRDGLARNSGLNIAHGRYVLFLDDDDWWLHEFVFQQMYDLLREDKLDVLNYAIIWRHVGYRSAPPGALLPMCASHVWRRSFVGTTRFDDAQYSSDTHFLDAMIAKNPRAAWTAMPMYYYNFMRPGSLSDLHKRGEIQ